MFQKKLEISLTNVFKIQEYDSIMWGYFFTRFTDFMLKGKSLLDIKIYFLLINIKRITK